MPLFWDLDLPCISLIILCTELLKFLPMAMGSVKWFTALNVKAPNNLY